MKTIIFLILSLFLTTLSASRTRQTCVQSYTNSYTLDVFNTTSVLLSGEGDRFEAIRIPFGFTFCNQPSVHVSLGGFDVDVSRNPFFDVSAENVDTTGFTLVVHGRSDVILYGVKVNYIADDIPPRIVA